MPFCEMRSGGSPVISSPPNTMRPEVGRSTPVRQLKKVLLPAPLGPMIARISPRATVMLTLPTAVRPPKRMVRPSVRRIGPAAPRSGWTGAPCVCEAVTRLDELARGGDDRLFLGADGADLGLHFAALEHYFSH